MAKTKAQRMKEYRARKKALMGDEWLRRENQRVKSYFVPVSELRHEQQQKRRERNKFHAASHRQKVKKVDISEDSTTNMMEQGEMENSMPPVTTDENNVSSTTSETHLQLKVKLTFPKTKGQRLNTEHQSRARKRVPRALAKQYRRNETLTNENISLKRRLNSARKKIERFEKKTQVVPSTPKGKTDAFLRSEGIDPLLVPKLRKKVLFAECVSAEIQEASTCTDQQRQHVVRRIVTGKVIKKYRLKSTVEHHTHLNRRKMNSSLKSLELKKRSKLQAINLKINREVRDFLERDDNSRVLPGKTDAVKVGREKIQKRVLNDYLYNLHAKFLSEVTYVVSLATFCRKRPRHITLVNFSSRSVCLCQKHQNFALKLRCLKNLKLTACTSPDKFMESYSNEEVTLLLQGISTTTVSYQEWKRKKMNDGKERMRIVDIELPRGEFVNMMLEAHQDFSHHISRVKEQYTSLKAMKDNLPKGHALIQMDFSENYVCQSLEEIQSAYWNPTAVTLHPTVIYHRAENGQLVHHSVVFVSDVLQHNASMVYIIVQKLVSIAKEHILEGLRAIHFWTDSPTSQYRNKTVFYLVSRFEEEFAVSATWHYFEAGHGKGPCDGLGGTAKRNADNAIKQGKAVIQDATDFFKWAMQSQSQIEYHKVTEEEFNQSKDAVDQHNANLKPVKGTMKIHSVLGEGNGQVRTRTTTCACKSCFTDRGFSVDTGCSWERHSLRKDGYKSVEERRTTVQNSADEVTPGESADERLVGLKRGDFVVIAYEKKCYIARVEEIDREDQEVEVSCMEECCKVDGRFRWPRKEDRLWIANLNVLKAINEPTATGKTRRVFAVCEETVEFMKEHNSKM